MSEREKAAVDEVSAWLAAQRPDTAAPKRRKGRPTTASLPMVRATDVAPSYSPAQSTARPTYKKPAAPPEERAPSNPVVQTLGEYWRKGLRAYNERIGLDLPIPHLGSADRTHLQTLIGQYGDSGVDAIKAGMLYLCLFWERICPRFTKTIGVSPTLSLLVRFHDSLISEGAVYVETQRAIDAYQVYLTQQTDYQRKSTSCVFYPGGSWDKDPTVQASIPETVRFDYRRALDIRRKFTAACWNDV